MSNINGFQALMPTKVLFGTGQISKIGEEAASLGKKALIVTGSQAMRRAGITARIEKSLTDKGVEFVLFEKVESNPSTDTADAGVKLALETGCDLVIGLGGGSAIDTAKAIASAAGLNSPIQTLMEKGMSKKGLPCIAVATTSGTGAEVTAISVLTIKAKNRKDALRSPYNFPNVAIVDPELTLNLSPYLTANTGIDALTHAVEAYTSRSAHPISDLYARQAISLVNRYLRRAVLVGNDLEAREGMALASNLAGIAIAYAGVGAAHGLGMTVGGICNTDHGISVGIALPYVIEFNLAANLEKYRDVAQLLGEDTKNLSLRDGAKLAAQAVRNLMIDLKLPLKYSQIGVRSELLASLVEDTKTQRAMLNNPINATEEDIKGLYQALL